MEVLNDLQTRNILNYKIVKSDGGVLKIQPSAVLTDKVKPSAGVEVRYTYSGPKDDKNRAFCKALLSVNRIYTRKEIDTMTAIADRDVWLYRGGWYTIPGTDGEVRRPSCRHTWRQKVIKVQNT